MRPLSVQQPFTFARSLEFMSRFAPCRDACVLASRSTESVFAATAILLRGLGRMDPLP